MTTTQIILIVVAVLIMLAGLYFIYRGIKRRELENQQGVIRDKNGIPILPRHERNIVDTPDIDDAMGGETVITPDRSHLQAIVDTEHTNADHTAADHASAYQSHTKATAEQGLGEQVEDATQPFVEVQDRRLDQDDREPDLFASLASATANITPAIETADEPEFTQNSPVLDKHLLSSAEQDQNSPLNNATANVNITLVPERGSPGVSGQTLLALVQQYGMKYGAMNMFHRYENNDGTGILWFSMMGITEEGISSFDLNSLPQSTFDGLVLFLSLPHPKALHGFDSMMSTAGLIAKELNMMVLDENNQPLSREQKSQLRLQVQAFQKNQQ